VGLRHLPYGAHPSPMHKQLRQLAILAAIRRALSRYPSLTDSQFAPSQP
jgi:hypothetical protein